MSALELRRERQLLAAALGVDASALPDLTGATPEGLRAVRVALGELQFARHRRTFRRIGKLAAAVPSGLAARIAQSALGPVVAARTAATMDPEEAVKLAGALPPKFLADLAVELDPLRAREIIAGVPQDLLLEVAALLVQRREHLTLRRFISVIAPSVAAEVVAALGARDLLRVAMLAEDDGALDAVLAEIGDGRLAELAGAIDDEEAALDLLAVLERVSPEQRARLDRALETSATARAHLASAREVVGS